ncbi:uncharacterized protein [Watersipora subatra]|uniref:uncharacterized protein n=1 Tax=Watersipora subatra TaxID=2589382 RepID=UPI00355AFBF3
MAVMKFTFVILFALARIGISSAISLGGGSVGTGVKIGANHKYSSSYLKQQSYGLKITNPGYTNSWKYSFTVWTYGHRVFVMMTGWNANRQVSKPLTGSAIKMKNWQSNPTSTHDSRVFECISVDPFDACNRITSSSSNAVIQLKNPHGSKKMCTISGSSNPYYTNCSGSESHWWVHG